MASLYHSVLVTPAKSFAIQSRLPPGYRHQNSLPKYPSLGVCLLGLIQWWDPGQLIVLFPL